jgi:tetratricopeptide (TPR) repeat protein
MQDRLGDRGAAVLAYNAALGSAPSRDPHGIAAAARGGIRRVPADLAAAQAYHLSLTGWRAFERGALDQADRALAGAATAAPTDTVVRVRLARVRAARKETAAALAEFDRLIAMRPPPSPIALGAAYLWSAEILEQQGRKDVALARYRAVNRIFGTDSRLIATAAKAIHGCRTDSQCRGAGAACSGAAVLQCRGVCSAAVLRCGTVALRHCRTAALRHCGTAAPLMFPSSRSDTFDLVAHMGERERASECLVRDRACRMEVERMQDRGDDAHCERRASSIVAIRCQVLTLLESLCLTSVFSHP